MDTTLMLLFRLFNGFMCLNMLALAWHGFGTITSRQIIHIRKIPYRGSRKRLITGAEAVELGVLYVLMGSIGAVSSFFGAVGDVSFFGIHVDFFGGMLYCLLPCMLPLMLVSMVRSLNEKKQKRKNEEYPN